MKIWHGVVILALVSWIAGALAMWAVSGAIHHFARCRDAGHTAEYCLTH